MSEKLSPIIFKDNDKTYRVKQIKYKQKDFEEDTAYFLSSYNGYVYPYRGEVDSFDDMYNVGIYIYKKKKYIKYPSNEEERDKYNKKKVIHLTPDSIFKDLNEVELEEIPQDIITDGDIFKPALKNTDDIALAGMKYAIGQKNINFNMYANRFPDIATKNNGRRALTHGNTLKMDMLTRFADVFDINAAIVLWDKKGCQNPMSEKYNKAYVIFNDEKIDFKDPDITIEEIERDD